MHGLVSCFLIIACDQKFTQPTYPHHLLALQCALTTPTTVKLKLAPPHGITLKYKDGVPKAKVRDKHL